MAKKKSVSARSSKAKKASRPAARKAAAKRTAPKKAAKKPAARKPAARPAPRKPAARNEPLRALARKIVDLTVSGNDDATLALYADGVESVEQGMPAMSGIEAIRQKFAMWRGMVTDSRWTARNVWVDGNSIAIEWVGTVTRAADGKVVDLCEVAVHDIENGKIVRERFYYDPAALRS